MSSESRHIENGLIFQKTCRNGSRCLPHLATSERRNDFRRGGRDLDLYSVFTGISAIRETLQSDVEIGDRPAEMDRRCAASQRVIQERRRNV